jgi:subtilase family serine protease
LLRRTLVSSIAVGAVVVAGLATTLPGASASLSGNHGRHAVRVCHVPSSKAQAACLAEVMVNDAGMVPQSASPPAGGLTPAQLQAAYKLSGLSSGGRTVAIVDAYGYTNLARDLATYRSQWGLAPCTVASGCLRILDQNGGSSLPRMNVGWAQEQALDVDAVSAACPDCKIVVVQAKSASFANLGTAVATAARQSGVVAISNSYGGSDAPDTTYGSYYNHPGIAVTASTGDNGYQGGSFPADSKYVTAVGGTSLTQAGGTARGWAETAWSGAGSGCSAYNAALPAASGFNTSCGTKRATADVSAAADPAKGGLAVYWPSTRTSSTWAQVGGTSESSPVIASVYALSGNTAGYANGIPYSHTASLFDVTSGSNGSCGAPLCRAGTSWDGPTGLGTPNGVGAF